MKPFTMPFYIALAIMFSFTNSIHLYSAAPEDTFGANPLKALNIEQVSGILIGRLTDTKLKFIPEEELKDEKTIKRIVDALANAPLGKVKQLIWEDEPAVCLVLGKGRSLRVFIVFPTFIFPNGALAFKAIRKGKNYYLGDKFGGIPPRIYILHTIDEKLWREIHNKTRPVSRKR